MMRGERMVGSFILSLIILQVVNSFEIFLEDRTEKIGEILPLKSFGNRTCQIPLFQQRYIIVRLSAEDLRLIGEKNGKDLVGFKFQIRATDEQVIEVGQDAKVSTELTNHQELKNVLLEDLFIFPNKHALGHIFNAYPSPSLVTLNDRRPAEIVWTLKGQKMEETTLTIRLDLFYENDASSAYFWTLKVLVTQPKRLIDRMFYYILPVLVIFISVQMGILLDTSILKSLVKKPAPVLIGFLAQYGVMPFLAMAIAKIFHYTPLNSLALFVIGCCPGSGASNQWTLLFDGDVNLSALMSFVSTASSFFMMPLYFYTLGRIYMDELSIRVPFLGLVRSLALVVVPYSLGIGISHWSPKTRSVVESLVKPMMLFLLIFFLIFGTIVNWYMFRMIDLYTALTAPLLPYLGFLFGALLAWICRLEWAHVKTIGIEAGIQNIGIAFMIILYSFPQPYATKAAIVVLVVAFLTTKPFWLIYVIRGRIKKYQKRKQLNSTNKQSPSVNGDGQSALAKEKQMDNANRSEEEIAEILQNL